MSAAAEHANHLLGSLLAETGLSPRALAAEINRMFGAGTVASTAAYHWRDAGGGPRDPLPTLVAYTLSRQLGRTIGVQELWQGRAGDSPLVQSAAAGMDAP